MRTLPRVFPQFRANETSKQGVQRQPFPGAGSAAADAINGGRFGPQ